MRLQRLLPLAFLLTLSLGATALAQTIKAGLSTVYYSAAKDSTAYNEAQKLYFFYGSRHFEPIWLDEN